jgi:L-asparaginase
MPPHDPVIPERRAEHEQALQGSSGTVGAVALDARGRIVAATSTGGIGNETPGRVSDSATVCGNYAAPPAGVSCTGIGEHIVSHAAAARVVIRVLDGMELSQAVRVTIAEAEARRFRFGLIALDRHGQAVVGKTGGMEVFSAIHDGRAVRTFLDPP